MVISLLLYSDLAYTVPLIPPLVKTFLTYFPFFHDPTADPGACAERTKQQKAAAKAAVGDSDGKQFNDLLRRQPKGTPMISFLVFHVLQYYIMSCPWNRIVNQHLRWEIALVSFKLLSRKILFSIV